MRDLPMSAPTVDRDGLARGEEGLFERLLADPATRIVELVGARVPLRPDRSLALRPPQPEDTETLLLYLGRHDGTAHVAACRPETPGDQGPREEDLDAAPFADLREVATDLSPTEATLFATALGLANWHVRHPRCPRCGEPTEVVQAGWVRRCPHDGSEHYPRTDPAVIMTIVDDDDRLLLGRGVTWPPDRMSVLAGFVEPGESAEHAVVREAAEEVGIAVGQVEYRGSQPWPMPCSLMLGFRAVAETTDLTPDGDELADARWYTRDELATAYADGSLRIPNRASIARALIEEWAGGPLSGPARP